VYQRAMRIAALPFVACHTASGQPFEFVVCQSVEYGAFVRWYRVVACL
jgi:hypothetical protein